MSFLRRVVSNGFATIKNVSLKCLVFQDKEELSPRIACESLHIWYFFPRKRTTMRKGRQKRMDVALQSNCIFFSHAYCVGKKKSESCSPIHDYEALHPAIFSSVLTVQSPFHGGSCALVICQLYKIK